MEKQTRRQFLKTVGLAAASGWTLSTLPTLAIEQAGRGKKRPNIIVLVTDDMGYADTGCYGAKDILTPNIDSIAQKGIRFTNGYVSCPVCSPTRAGLATGRYQQRFGYYGNAQSRVGLPLTEVTIADVLKSGGYVTGAVGKWHLGLSPQYHPFKRGYDEFFGFLAASHSYIDPQLDTANPIMRGTEPVNEKEYLTDAFTREAIAFVERHRRETFFLYLAYNAVHAPMQAPQRYRDGFQHISDASRRVHAGMLTALDEGIGKFLAKLRELALEDNTLLFYVNDNGGAPGNSSSNGPLRATKGTMYEGGIRVPFMIQWPSRLKGGQVYKQPVIVFDILPTAAAAAGAELPKDRKIDGIDLLPYLAGKKKTPPHDVLFWNTGENHAVRQGNWKLVSMGGEVGLFDLSTDIGESRDLKTEKADVFKEMQDVFKDWSSQMPEPLAVPRQRDTTGSKKARPKKAGKDRLKENRK